MAWKDVSLIAVQKHFRCWSLVKSASLKDRNCGFLRSIANDDENDLNDETNLYL